MNRDTFFAFTHAIRLTLKAHGLDPDSQEAIYPVLDRMALILQSPKASLVAFHDNIENEESKSLRELETALCDRYIDLFIAVNQNEETDEK